LKREEWKEMSTQNGNVTNEDKGADCDLKLAHKWCKKLGNNTPAEWVHEQLINMGIKVSREGGGEERPATRKRAKAATKEAEKQIIKSQEEEHITDYGKEDKEKEMKEEKLSLPPRNDTAATPQGARRLEEILRRAEEPTERTLADILGGGKKDSCQHQEEEDELVDERIMWQKIDEAEVEEEMQREREYREEEEYYAKKRPDQAK
jgi:hypothetical protein